MFDDAHLALRQAFYRAWGAYHAAAADYWGAAWITRAPGDAERRVAVRTTAAALDTAITALLGELGQMEPSARSEEERTRMARIQELLQHELALLPDIE